MKNYLFTSESVTEGHPDKICDQISDAILDECLKQDPASRVGVEVCTKTGMILVAGEITTKANLDIPKIARQTLKEIGYTSSLYGIDYETCAILVHIERQSPDISQGVTQNEGEFKEQGAGDQGMMFGYACNETPEFMPLPIQLAHKLTKRLALVRKINQIPYLGPDGKSQVTIEYERDIPKRIETIVISNQHAEQINQATLKKDIKEKVINPVCSHLIDDKTKIFINPTGIFVKGGPFADTGLTGRKIIVDTYGGTGRHGGGAFSGKDPSKVDRSAAYAARYIAKNIVAANLADKCEVQLAYAIGIAKPVSININTFGTNKVSEELLAKLSEKHFPTKPQDIIEQLKLQKPIYQKTAAYGHFGRDNEDFTWEKTDKVEILKQEIKSAIVQDTPSQKPLKNI